MGPEVIQQLLAPALMISACGLLCLAQFARYTAIVNRLRAFSHERLELVPRIHSCRDDRERRVLESRAAGLGAQSDQILAHARMIRNALMCLVGCILAMVASSLLIGLSLVVPSLEGSALLVFVLGLLLVAAGMVLVLAELRVSIAQAKAEIQNVGRLEGGLSEGEAMLP